MPQQTNNFYPDESIGSIMSTKVLTAGKGETLENVFELVRQSAWDDIQYVYVTGENGELEGMVDLSSFSEAQLSSKMSELMKKPKVTANPNADQETAVIMAIEHDVNCVPVVNHSGSFLGAITSRKIIDIMHQEHLEDALIGSGMRGRGSHILKLATSRYTEVVSSRAPWLIFGSAVGLLLGYIGSRFEHTLSENVAVAFFVPVIAYVADSVGTQAEAIAVRSLAIARVKSAGYLFRELIVGLILGIMLGAFGWAGAFLISRSYTIALIVGLSLFAASTIASVLASLIPITLKALGRDPALGSGPLATALQDVISVLIYFIFAMILL